ncbi:alpha/beta fold hydrolase [Shimia aestuarii]|uniref:Pimeloyl-ACP methyl ester carboxylesterase n=1 Tax=Shimia aestuarii TaxID=254406 RepID=A0A1I4I3D6_9RHOB|nr:alpha/beta hydrolase [Shimia aestuarii]SFL48885.1 Pimeloyl-ACP methyl ester carboxylesterase [Shimia aestuarii]
MQEKTYWREMGQGPRKVLALHCTMAHSGAWRGLSECLGDGFTVLAPDMIGHGRSSDYDGESCTGSLVYEAILDRIDAPVDVVAHSFGAVVALRFAVAHPELVRSLVLYEPVFFALAMELDVAEFAGHDAQIEEIRARIARGDNEGAARLFMADWGDGTPWAALPEQVRGGFAKRIPFVIGSQNYVAFDTPGTMPRLGEITAPTVVMDGAQSPKVIGVVCDTLGRRIPGARRVTVEGAGHMGAISRPDALAAELLRLSEADEAV